MISGPKGQKVVRACTIRLLNLGPAKHEKVVIYIANQRSSNVCRIEGAAKLRSNSKASSKKVKQPGSESEKPFVLARKGF